VIEMADANTARSVSFHRVEYPVQKVVDKIHAIEALNDWLGDRLLEGR
jgi:hypothetical protein